MTRISPTYWLFGGAAVFDTVGALGPTDPFFFNASFWLLTVGILVCLISAIRRFVLRNSTPQEQAFKLWYQIANLVAVLLFIASWVLRHSHPASPSDLAIITSFTAVVVAVVAGWFGGEVRRWVQSLSTPIIITFVTLVLVVTFYQVGTSSLFHRPIRDDSHLTLRGHRGSVSSVVFSPDGHYIASGGWDNTVRIWNANTGWELGVLKGHSDRVMAVVFSPDGHRLVSGSKDATARVWDVPSGRLIDVLRNHKDRVTSVAFSPDGSLLATGSRDDTIKIWDVSSWRELRTLIGHRDSVWSVSFSPDGHTLASGSWDGTIRMWDIAGQTWPHILDDGMRVSSIAFSSDGRWLASGSDQIKIWSVEIGRQVRTLAGAHGPVTFNPRGDFLYSTGNRAIMIWDANSGTLLRTLLGHSDHLNSVAVSSDGKFLASASDDGSIKVWKARP